MATDYYCDFDNGDDGADGLTPTGDAVNGPWATLDQFTENARAVGDKLIVRGSMVQTVSSNLTFTTTGSFLLPIEITRDYLDEWSDHVDLSGTATATLTFGSKTITFSADVSGVLATGDFIYAASDDNEEFCYEVETVSTVTVTLYLPYKGDQAGSGKTMYNMGDNPIWNTITGVYNWLLSSDNYWKFTGLHVRGTDSNGNVYITGSHTLKFINCIFEGNGTADTGIRSGITTALFHLQKCRTYNCAGVLCTVKSIVKIVDSLIGDVASNGLQINALTLVELIDVEFRNLTNGIYCTQLFDVKTKNCTFTNISGNNYELLGNATSGDIGIEDHNNEPGDTRYTNGLMVGLANDTFLYQSETTKVRGGGNSKSIKVLPTVNINNIWNFGRLKLLELPIYATTDSKTYTIYFACDDNTDWDDNPTAAQLWVEFEAWGHATNNHRKITKSSGTVDFKTDTDFDQSLAVTVAPAQAGVGYLRVWYAKPKEATNDNIFYVDPLPVIS